MPSWICGTGRQRDPKFLRGDGKVLDADYDPLITSPSDGTSPATTTMVKHEPGITTSIIAISLSTSTRVTVLPMWCLPLVTRHRRDRTATPCLSPSRFSGLGADQTHSRVRKADHIDFAPPGGESDEENKERY